MSTRRNRYAAACDVCGSNVPPGFGHLVRQPGHWDVRHVQCRPDLPYAHGATERMTVKAGCLDLAILARNNEVIEAPPPAVFMQGWSVSKVEDHCRRRGWQIKRTPAGRG